MDFSHTLARLKNCPANILVAASAGCVIGDAASLIDVNTKCGRISDCVNFTIGLFVFPVFIFAIPLQCATFFAQHRLVIGEFRMTPGTPVGPID
jgi:hypothetical protein